MKRLAIAGAVVLTLVLGGCSRSATSGTTTTTVGTTATTASPATTPKSTGPTTTSPAPAGRKVQGTAVTLGAGSFVGGQDVQAGVYDVAAPAGQSGNFTVEGTNSYNEILGGSTGGVPSLSVTLSDGDIIAISSLSQVTMTAQ
jgi:hypothetical protein